VIEVNATSNGGLFPHPDAELRRRMDSILDLIDKTFPLPSRFRSGLPRDVAALSRSLTDKRSDRDDGYLGKPAALSAYLRYFLPWNIYRLARLLPSLPLDLADGDSITDLGSGPLTFPIALWLARPDLRSKKLEFRCLDRTGKVLEAGSALFAALVAGTNTPWKIRTIRGSLGTRIEGGKAALVTAVNVLNELFWDDRAPVAEQAERKASFLSALANGDGSVLVVEPGIPRSGEFITALRSVFIELGRDPLSPCPHALECPLPGGRRGAKWCHFVFDTEDAPARLHKLSSAAGIPKERATLSFLLAGPISVKTATQAASAPETKLPVRIISDVFPLDEGGAGRYACSERGLTLVAGSRRAAEALESGDLVDFPLKRGRELRDPKSGAFVVEIPD
jgi:ribosomal protein RSM22 (predicted rRNA methylase)